MYNSTIVPPPENEEKMLAQQYTKATTGVHDGVLSYLEAFRGRRDRPFFLSCLIFFCKHKSICAETVKYWLFAAVAGYNDNWHSALYIFKYKVKIYDKIDSAVHADAKRTLRNHLASTVAGYVC